MSQSTNPTMFLNATADINTWVELANKAGSGVINPEVFYNKQLLDTIREMINEEIDHREVGRGEVAQCSNPPPDAKPRRCTLLRWLRSLL